MKEYIKLKDNGKLVINNATSIHVEEAEWVKDKLVASIYINTLDVVIPVVFTERQVLDFVSSPQTIDSLNVYGEHEQREFIPTEDFITDAMHRDIADTVKAMLMYGEEFTNE